MNVWKTPSLSFEACNPSFGLAFALSLKSKGKFFGKSLLIVNFRMFILPKSPYEKGNIFNRDPLRERKLLMHRRELNKLFGVVSQKGLTLVPLSLYFSGKNCKVEVGLCVGKKLYDKRDSEAKRQADRDIDRAMKGDRR